MSYGHSKRPSATKSGPGRYHSDGMKKARPIPQHGASSDFELHKASAEKKQRRDLVKVHGRRQAIKALKYWRIDAKLSQRIANDEAAAASAWAAHDEQMEAA